jgi:predicted transcriptional regulator
MNRLLDVRLASATEALDRLEDAWNRAAEGGAAQPSNVLSFPDLPALLGALTPARWRMLEQLRAAGPMTIFALAKRLGRDYKNVHTDINRFAALGLVERRRDGRVAVPWDAVRAELRLGSGS